MRSRCTQVHACGAHAHLRAGTASLSLGTMGLSSSGSKKVADGATATRETPWTLAGVLTTSAPAARAKIAEIRKAKMRMGTGSAISGYVDMVFAGSIARLLDVAAARFVVTPRCARLFRCWVAGVVVLDCVDRWSVLEWMYTDTGALPRTAVLPAPHEDRLLWVVCAHAWHGSLTWVRALVVLEACAAVAFGLGVRWCGALTWWLHLSICVRSAPLIYILDRYLNLLLLYATLLPTPPANGEWSLASLGIALQLLAIYADAGWAKWSDPAGAWTLAAPVAALDTYMRHTPAARLAHALLGGDGLRLAGAAAVATELLAAPLALCAAPSVLWRRLAAAAGIALHLGIALTMRNTAFLSLAATAMWLPFLDGPRRAHFRCNTEGEGCRQRLAAPHPPITRTAADSTAAAPPAAAAPAPPAPPSLTHSGCRPPLAVPGSRWRLAGSCTIATFVLASLWHQWARADGPGCGVRAPPGIILRAILHNRWDVFSSAESHVVWEMAPARLSDGSMVDLWRGGDGVDWGVPEAEAEGHAGRWRSLPLTAERDAVSDSAFWRVLCTEWEAREAERWLAAGGRRGAMQASGVALPPKGDSYSGAGGAGADTVSGGARGWPAAPRTVVGFHFYLMQADIVPAPRAGLLRRLLWPWSRAANEPPHSPTAPAGSHPTVGSHPAVRCEEGDCAGGGGAGGDGSGSGRSSEQGAAPLTQHAHLGRRCAGETLPSARRCEGDPVTVCEEDPVTGQQCLVPSAPPLGRAEESEAAGGWPRPRYGPARKRLLRSFSCLPG